MFDVFITITLRQRFAAAAQIPDLGGCDLAFPESERTRHILSAFINFIKFNEQIDPLFERLRGKSKAAVEKRRKAEKEVIDITQKYEIIECVVSSLPA